MHATIRSPTGSAGAARDRALGAAATQMDLWRHRRHAGGVRGRRQRRLEVRHSVEVPGSERAHLQQWPTKRCGWDVRAPELATAGSKLVGGRLLPGPRGPASFLIYESATGERFTVYTAKADAETTQMRYEAAGGESTLFWTDRGVGYVVSGGADRGRLTQIARAVYDEMDKNGG